MARNVAHASHNQHHHHNHDQELKEELTDEWTEELTEELIEVADSVGMRRWQTTERNCLRKTQMETAEQPFPLEGQLAWGHRNFKGQSTMGK